MSLSNLIRALTILKKYGDPNYPTHCENDVLTICDIYPDDVSAEDKAQLEELGFIVSGDNCFVSFSYGSA